MNNKIKYSIFYSISHVSVKNIESWIDLVSQCFVPKSIMSKVTSKGKHSKYDRDKLLNNLSKELDNEIVSIYLTDDINNLSVTKNYGGASLIISFNLEDNEKVDFDEIINKNMISEKIIVAYKCSYDDHYWQNTDSLLSYQAEGRSLDKVRLTQRKFGLRDQIVDVEYNPGHVHMVNGIWFGSCYKMWFGKEYYHYIPKNNIKNFKDCFENVELENEVIRITLYEDIWAYDESQNRKIQWDFRNTVEMDKVAHLLEKCLKTKEIDSDPEIEIENGVFSNGGTRLIKYYYDSNGNLIQKSKAKKARVCVFNQEGQLMDENIIESR